ncbi:hypothetical protein BD324DRAFT_678693 [Kockovaella imperatae]|uniref:CENP-V/GFA domain-containing protein n=1 Tax=Kockovaella imperatae TaxID=4999 RepID=A0A1Y1UPZ0_9TREE|nr:hypothetical protein BD324DRAFT_678693 [Kockovaella imperatae]ORX39574.1 hypothetical protein BD324DRAFT_678693 [Kockovaella imperatae]
MSVKVACHCGAFKHDLEITTDIPHEDTFCCCDSCRRRTGQLGLFPFPASASDSELVTKSSLKRYDTQPGTGNTVSSFYCGQCGSKVFIQTVGPDQEFKGGGWMLGCFDKMELNDKCLIDIHGFSFADETIDGGAAAFWTQVNGKPLKSYVGCEAEWKAPAEAGRDDSEYLNLHCRCGGFDVHVSRPNPELPLPKPCWWYLPPKTEAGIPQRYMASWCACKDCRGATGSCLPAHPWVQIPFVDIHTATSKDAPLLPAETKMTTKTDLPGCTRYESSKGIARYFCSTCGATVLYFDADRDFIGAWAVGLIDSKEGSLAPSWLFWWTGRDGHPNPPIHCKETGDAFWGKGIMSDFESGWIEWGKKVGQRT